MHCFRLLFIVLLTGLPAAAQQAADADLDRLTAAFRQQRDDARRSALAVYADQLRALMAQLEKKADSAGLEKAKQEFRSVMGKLDAMEAPKTSKEGTPEVPAGPAKSAVQEEEDLDAIFGTAQDPTGKSETPVETKNPGKNGAVTLRPQEAIANPPGPLTREFWKPGASLSWTLQDVAAGNYRVRLNYAAATAQAGGTGEILVAGSPVPFTIKPKHDSWEAPDSSEVAVLEVQKCPLEFVIRCTSLAEGSQALFALQRVDLIPEAATPPPVAKPPAEAPAPKADPKPEPPAEKPKGGIEF
ncbi:MAG: hypothetical protein KA004_06395 [Verrucomicrobiales bacterium]|nr:hypothetical protein [Verrucomicrobiales bacterium]